MEVVIRQHEQQCGVTAADIIADAVACGATTLGLATGSSPLSVYRELIRRHRKGGLTFADVQAFLLDEYVGLPPGHPQSYAHVIRAEFTDHVGIASDRVHSPDGIAEDIFGAAQAYDALITDAGPIDVQLLGIGANGHIGFNEPGDELASRTHRVKLADSTRRDNAGLFAGDISKVPREALSMGMGTILKAATVILIATGERKAQCVEQMVHGAVTPRLPASFLQLHRDVELYLDHSAASRLSPRSRP